MLLILNVFFLIKLVVSGIIRPALNPIENTIANRNEFSDYKFTMVPETNVPAGGFVEIIFPSQYLAGLGIDQIVQGTCIPTCEIDKYTVKFFKTEPMVKDIVFSLQLNQVLNPEKKGGTGNFIVRTMKGENIFDENLIFGTLGIADYIVPFNSAIIEIVDTVPFAQVGKKSTYNFYMKSRDLLPSGTVYQITIPEMFEFQNAGSDTKLIKINNMDLDQVILPANLVVVNTKTLQITNIPWDLQPSNEIAFQLFLTNPKYVVSPDGFRVIAYRKLTSMAYAWRSSLMGIDIYPGSINSASITPVISVAEIAKSKTMDFDLIFKNTNPIPSGGVIKVDLPDEFQIVKDTPYDMVMIISGIQEKSLTEPISLTSDTQTMIITSFADILAETQIQIRIRLTTKQSDGESTPFQITTFQDSSQRNVIDQFTPDATTKLTINVLDIDSFNPIAATVAIVVDPITSVNHATIRIPLLSSFSSKKLTINFGSNWDFAGNPACNQGACIRAAKKIEITLPLLVGAQILQILIDLATPLQEGYFLNNLICLEFI